MEETFVNDVTLTRNTSLEKDHGVNGDDARDYILAFSRKFNVDVTRFVF